MPAQRTGRDAVRPPLSGHRVLRTRDLVAAQAGISGYVWPARLRICDQRSGGEGFAARLHHASLGVTGLAYLDCGDVAVSATLAADPGGERAVLVALPWAGTVECWRGRERTAIAGRTAVVLQPGQVTVTHWQPGAALFLVVLPQRLVTETLGDLTGEPTPTPNFDLAQPGLGGWARLVRAVCDSLDSGGLVDHPLTTRYVQQALAAGLLTAARHDQAGRVRDTTPGVPGRRVRVAMDWIHAHHGDPTIGPADIARATGLSQRTLYRAIRAETGMTPAECLRRVRLVAARAALRAATPAEASVTEIAGRVGFIDLSWFATQYQRVYGERPVDTLRARTTI
ncbi:MAG TPA: AraC family transcriptional regulator [Micromonosporaceae bacterium]